MLTEAEIVAEIEKHGGKIEPIKRTCQFQGSIEDIFPDYCKQIRDQNRDYMAFMGLTGGLGAYCWGGRMPHINIAGKTDHRDVPPCPYRAAVRILGWNIKLPSVEVKV